MQMDSFDKLYVDQLRDMYNAEKQLTKALPKMAKAASNRELRAALEEHLEVTKRQVERLEEIFRGLGRPATGKTCKGMGGLIEEGQEILEEDFEPDVLDAGIIAAAQKVEHYEIASYGTLRTFAETKGDTKSARILQEILEEEKEADRRLTDIAESTINAEAETAGSETGDKEGEKRGSPRTGTRQTGAESERRREGDGPWL
ncbi:MAG TPA: ferritin-like domain-containing protein [Candidatus Eisenbacteria bacterium]|nr:ferritin-like domain-containing protein [Candidatus Eisenbacteria bacterium]